MHHCALPLAYEPVGKRIILTCTPLHVTARTQSMRPFSVLAIVSSLVLHSTAHQNHCSVQCPTTDVCFCH